MKKSKQESYSLKNGEKELNLIYSDMGKAVSTLRAVNHDLRRAIIDLLTESENGKMNVTDIYVKLREEQSVVSQHLAIMRQVGIVKAIRDGKFIHYSLNQKRLEQISQLVEKLTV